MKKFSTLDKVDLHDNEPKTYNETLTSIIDEMLTVGVAGENAELAGKIDLTINGKQELVSIIEKLTNVYVLKESVKILNSFKAKTHSSNSLNWVDNEIDTINESINKVIDDELIIKLNINKKNLE